jgi:hypothetical protein
VERDSKVDHPRSAASPPRAIDLPLLAYGLASGVLAVSAGTLLAHAEQRLGALTKAVSLLATVAITVVAGLSADSVLEWLLPLNRNGDTSDVDRRSLS